MDDFDISENSLDQNNVETFLQDFNTKFGVSTTSLIEVLDICDALFCDLATNSIHESSENQIDKLNKKLQSEKKKNQQLTEEINRINSQNSDLQNALEKLEDEKMKNEELFISLEDKINSMQKELQESNSKNQTLSKQKKSFETAISSMNDMYETQMNESIEIFNHNKLLIECVQKQNLVISNLEKLLSEKCEKCNKNKEEQNSNNSPTIIPENYVDQYEIISSIFKTISESIPPLLIPDLVKIKDNNEENCSERISNLIGVLLNYNKKLNEDKK